MSPLLVFECLRRIFSREDHPCLSATNKPKAVEVVLKFVKLHDGINFSDHVKLRKHFSHIIELDFVKERTRPLLPATVEQIRAGYEATPDNFGAPD